MKTTTIADAFKCESGFNKRANVAVWEGGEEKNQIIDEKSLWI